MSATLNGVAERVPTTTTGGRGSGGYTHVELFAGISGFGLGFERAGCATVARVEINKDAQRVLRRIDPNGVLLDDVRTAGAHNLPHADVITFGSPCQDLSVAGKRQGLIGERSGLFHEAIRIVDELRPTFAVWENVPGALSSNAGRDFAAVLGAFRNIGARDIAWRILDAQYFGVAQRRRRLFVVADFAGERAAEILFESGGSYGHPAPRREAGQGTAATISASAPSRRNGGSDPTAGHFILAIDSGSGGDISPVLTSEGADASEDGRGRKAFVVSESIEFVRTYGMRRSDDYEAASVEPTLAARDYKSATDLVAIAIDVRNFRSNGDVSGTLQSKPTGGYSLNYQNPIAFMAGQSSTSGSVAASERVSPTLRGAASGTNSVPTVAFNWNAGATHSMNVDVVTGTQRSGHHNHPAALGQFGVRRLTPTECERLQGFPDNWTAFDADGKPISDSGRYRLLGNAVCVNVAEWLAHRLMTALSMEAAA